MFVCHLKLSEILENWLKTRETVQDSFRLLIILSDLIRTSQNSVYVLENVFRTLEDSSLYDCSRFPETYHDSCRFVGDSIRLFHTLIFAGFSIWIILSGEIAVFIASAYIHTWLARAQPLTIFRSVAWFSLWNSMFADIISRRSCYNLRWMLLTPCFALKSSSNGVTSTRISQC